MRPSDQILGPVIAAAECDGLEDLPFAGRIGNASRPAPRLYGKADGRLQRLASSVAVRIEFESRTWLLVRSVSEGVAAMSVKHSPEQEARLIPSAGLKVTERSYSSYQENEWDNFARDSFGSFLGSWRVITARRLFGAVRLFDFILSAGSSASQKVGQCALLINAQSVRPSSIAST
jgi:hypothetical protein